VPAFYSMLEEVAAANGWAPSVPLR
jgi:hypothetical protein